MIRRVCKGMDFITGLQQRLHTLVPGENNRKLDGQHGIQYQQEVGHMIASLWLMLSSMMYSLQLSTGSFPKTLTKAEEAHYLALAAEGDLDARNILIERNLRLVAHIMKKY